ncbi:hypothetical protein I858_015635 [Planococcus versutus]|uniref:Helix-turn-helix domain-containing protein n=2 Tax=Planococcus versutus TaxID=1302659 RepID=A0A1B1S5G7_9BACL|nr:hypothetical protein I858_015635 [Planococcus versutus]
MLVTMTVEDLRKVVSEEFNKAMEKRGKVEGVIKQLPAILTREEFMEVMHISSTTATRIFDRPDFRVFRQGKILIESEFLLEWIRRNSDWVEEYTGYFRSVG